MLGDQRSIAFRKSNTFVPNWVAIIAMCCKQRWKCTRSEKRELKCKMSSVFMYCLLVSLSLCSLVSICSAEWRGPFADIKVSKKCRQKMFLFFLQGNLFLLLPLLA